MSDDTKEVIGCLFGLLVFIAIMLAGVWFVYQPAWWNR